MSRDAQDKAIASPRRKIRNPRLNAINIRRMYFRFMRSSICDREISRNFNLLVQFSGRPHLPSNKVLNGAAINTSIQLALVAIWGTAKRQGRSRSTLLLAAERRSANDRFEVTAVVALPTESGWEYQNETAGVRRLGS